MEKKTSGTVRCGLGHRRAQTLSPSLSPSLLFSLSDAPTPQLEGQRERIMRGGGVLIQNTFDRKKERKRNKERERYRRQREREISFSCSSHIVTVSLQKDTSVHPGTHTHTEPHHHTLCILLSSNRPCTPTEHTLSPPNKAAYPPLQHNTAREKKVETAEGGGVRGGGGNTPPSLYSLVLKGSRRPSRHCLVTTETKLRKL